MRLIWATGNTVTAAVVSRANATAEDLGGQPQQLLIVCHALGDIDTVYQTCPLPGVTQSTYSFTACCRVEAW